MKYESAASAHVCLSLILGNVLRPSCCGLGDVYTQTWQRPSRSLIVLDVLYILVNTVDCVLLAAMHNMPFGGHLALLIKIEQK